MLSVTLEVMGEVREEFVVGVYATSHNRPSARGKGELQVHSMFN